MDFGTNLKRVLDDLGIKQNELAKRMGKEETYISRVINNKYNPSFGSILKYAEALDVHPSVFFEEPTNEEKEVIASLLKDLPDDMKKFIRAEKSGLYLYLDKNRTFEDLTLNELLEAVRLYKQFKEGVKG